MPAAAVSDRAGLTKFLDLVRPTPPHFRRGLKSPRRYFAQHLPWIASTRRATTPAEGSGNAT